jgi:hypothetical protein
VLVAWAESDEDVAVGVEIVILEVLNMELVAEDDSELLDVPNEVCIDAEAAKATVVGIYEVITIVGATGTIVTNTVET